MLTDHDFLKATLCSLGKIMVGHCDSDMFIVLPYTHFIVFNNKIHQILIYSIYQRKKWKC